MKPRLLDVLFGVAIVLSGMVAFEVHAMRSGLDLLVRSRVDVSQHASAAWREVDGVQFSMRTYRDPNETAAEFVERHEAAVFAMTRQLGRREPDQERRHEGR